MILKIFHKEWGWRFIDKVRDARTHKVVIQAENKTYCIVDIELQDREGVKELSFSTKEGILNAYLLNDEGKTVEKLI